MTVDVSRLIENAEDTARRLFPQEPEQRAQKEAEMLREYLRAIGRRLADLMELEKA